MQLCANTKCSEPTPGLSGRCLTCNSLVVGKLVRDRYLVLKMVSRGGFGATYLIEDVDLFNERRVLKELRPLVGEGSGAISHARRETAERLFKREAETLLRLNHRGIPKLYAYFVEDGYSYLLQEYIPGRTLIEELEKQGKNFTESEARGFLMELAEILKYLHSQDPPIIHRDIKPQNLMRHSDGHLLLIDFGAVCRAANQEICGQTLIGSPGYAAPEQILGRPLPQSDLYAAGATVVRLITGVHPTKLTNRRTERLEWDPDSYVSKEFGELVEQMLARDPELRIPSADALIDALKAISSVPCLQMDIFVEKHSPERNEDVTVTSIAHTRLSGSGNHTKLRLSPPCASLVTALKNVSEVKQGELKDIPVPILIFKLYQKRATGELTLTCKDIVKTVSFDTGSIVFATSSVAEERLGTTLIRQGRISPEQYREAEALMERTGQRLGTAMLQLGMIRQDELLDIIIEHVSSIVYSVFSWIEGDYSFKPEPPTDEAIKMPFPTADIIFEGIRRMDDMELVQQWLGDFKRPLRTTSDPLLLYQAVNLNPREAFIVSRIDTALSVDDLLSLGGLPENETLKTLCGLLSIGMLEVVGEEPAARAPVSTVLSCPAPLPQELDFTTVAQFCYEVESKLNDIDSADAYALLEIDRQVSDREVREAYQRMARKFHPDRNSQLLNYNLNILGDLERIFSAVAYAYEMLRTEQRRKEYNRRQHDFATRERSQSDSKEFVRTSEWADEEDYDKLIQIGRRKYQEQKFDEARMVFEKATRVNPCGSEAHFHLARTLAHTRAGFQIVETAFRRAIEIAPDRADYYAEFGLYLQRFQLHDLAEGMFKNCLQIDPDHPVARRIEV